MICRPCQRAADYATVIGAGWATSKHRQCLGGTWCDCQHRVPAGVPESMATVGTPENGRLVGIAARIELEDLVHAAPTRELCGSCDAGLPMSCTCPAEHAEPRTAAGHPAHTPGDNQ